MLTSSQERSKSQSERSFSLSYKPKMRYTCADLFAGAGGLAVGFHSAGFKCQFFNEIDAQASETFSQNFPQAEAFVCPIQDLSVSNIEKNVAQNAMN